MNKVISREYVEKNYIHKDKIRDLFKYKEKLLLDLENFNILRNKTETEEKTIKELEIEMKLLKKILEE